MRVALLALESADRVEALAVLGDELEKSAVLLSETVSALINDKGEDARATAARVFKNHYLLTLDGRARSNIVRLATSAGFADGLRLYLDLLEIPGKTVGDKTYDRPVAEVAADEALSVSVGMDRAAMEIRNQRLPPQEKVAAVKTWLKEKIKQMEGQK
jgi:hypothetical protein